jgi:nucleotide-binding universal stress UspA family protein
VNGYRLLVCVNRSPAAIAAARLAIELAGHGGTMRLVSVAEDGDTARQIDALGRRERSASQRLEEGVRAVLDRVLALASNHHIDAEAQILRGEPLQAIIRDARAWDPDLVVIGRTTRSGPGSPLIGSLAKHVVEFAEWPVVVVPEAPTGAAARTIETMDT